MCGSCCNRENDALTCFTMSGRIVTRPKMVNVNPMMTVAIPIGRTRNLIHRETAIGQAVV